MNVFPMFSAMSFKNNLNSGISLKLASSVINLGTVLYTWDSPRVGFSHYKCKNKFLGL